MNLIKFLIDILMGWLKKPTPQQQTPPAEPDLVTEHLKGLDANTLKNMPKNVRLDAIISSQVPVDPNEWVLEPLRQILPTEELVQEFKAEVVDKGVVKPLELSHILARIATETGFTTFEENLNYSASRLMQVWPKVFKNTTIAATYAHNPVALANFIYGGKYGNDDPNDGWKFRGRGALGVTFQSNYEAMQNDTGLPVLENPDLLATEHKFASAYWFWNKYGLSKYITDDHFESCRKIGGKVNTGSSNAKPERIIGFDKQVEFFNQFWSIFKNYV